jgi:hypothetical protein
MDPNTTFPVKIEMGATANASEQDVPKITKHPGVYPYRCFIKNCAKPFKAKKSLTDHLRIHKGERPYVCFLSICKKTFTQYSSLQKHERIHRGEKPYTCSQCKHAFTQVSNLKRHERLHTGERPHLCKHCGKSFSTSSNLKQHAQIHENERSKFACKICGRAYFYNSSLKKHMREHLGIRLKTEGNSKSEKRRSISSKLEDKELKRLTKQEKISAEMASKNDEVRQPTLPLIQNMDETLKTLLPNMLDPFRFQHSFNSMKQEMWKDTINLNSYLNSTIPKLSPQMPQEAIHPHFHSDHCDHEKILHKGHVDYLHDNKLCHHKSDGTVSVHELEVSEGNPNRCRPLNVFSHLTQDFAWWEKYRMMMDMLMPPRSYNYNQPPCNCTYRPPNFSSLNNVIAAKNLVNLEDVLHPSDPHQNNSQGCNNCAQSRQAVNYLQSLQAPPPISYDSFSTAASQFYTNPFGGNVIQNDNAKVTQVLASLKEDQKHSHGNSCGHNQITHHDHLDYIVDGKLHHVHGDHCDDHGEIVTFASKKRKLNAEIPTVELD